MKTALFYFTGTGNCLKVARDLAAALGEADIFNIAKDIDKPDLSADRVGIIYPVFEFGTPLIIRRFIDKLNANNKFYFVVITYGSLAGDPMAQNISQFASRGLKLSAGFYVRMPGNYTPFYGAIPEEEQKKLFALEEEKVKRIAGIIKDNKPAPIERKYWAWPLLTGLINGLVWRTIPRQDKYFRADDKCVSCGTCVKACPVKNVKLVEGKPAWLHKCEQCFACLQWCPKEAIQFGKVTSKRKRYHNPHIKLEDIVIK